MDARKIAQIGRERFEQKHWMGPEYAGKVEFKRVERLKSGNIIFDTMNELDRIGLSYRLLEKNIGHFRIWEEWDLWPTTGTWINIKTHKRGKGGLKELLEQI
ncbi:MAG: hypothetical protein WC477_07595 [Patescibacteria group bacterium]